MPCEWDSRRKNNVCFAGIKVTPCGRTRRKKLSTPANQRYNFQTVPVVQLLLGVLRARYQLQVHLDCNEARIEPMLFDDLGYRGAGRKSSHLTVDLNLYESRSLHCELSFRGES